MLVGDAEVSKQMRAKRDQYLAGKEPPGTCNLPLQDDVPQGRTYTLALAASSIIASRAAVAGAAQEIVVWAMWSLVGSLAAATLLFCLDVRSSLGSRRPAPLDDPQV